MYFNSENLCQRRYFPMEKLRLNRLLNAIYLNEKIKKISKIKYKKLLLLNKYIQSGFNEPGRGDRG